MYPLQNFQQLKRGYLFLQKTSYTAHHLGTDYIVPIGTPIRAPFDGTAEQFFGTQGGATIHFSCKVNGIDYLIRFLHLSQFEQLGKVKAGEVIGYTGNTGSITTGPHCHIDISIGSLKLNDINNFVNPDTFNWNPMQYTFPLTVVNKDESYMKDVQKLVELYSKGSVTISCDYLTHPIVSTSENLTIDEGLAYLTQLGISKACLMFYEGHGPYAFGKQSFNPATNQPFTLQDIQEQPFFTSFEIAHMLQVFYNTHRPAGTPPIIVQDLDIPTEALVYAKYDTLTPYIPYLISLGEGTDMLFKQVQVPGTKDVWLIRDGKKTLVFNAFALQVVGDFSQIEPITQSELDATPDSGLTLAGLQNE